MRLIPLPVHKKAPLSRGQAGRLVRQLDRFYRGRLSQRAIGTTTLLARERLVLSADDARQRAQ